MWFGPMQPESRMLGSTAATPAAARWSQGLLTGLRHCGVEIVHIGHEPARVWPFGPMISRAMAAGPRTRDPGPADIAPLHEVPIGFLNLPKLRWASLSHTYDRETAKQIGSWRPDILVTYNVERFFSPAITRLHRADIPWVPIVLDGDDSQKGWANLTETSSAACGGVFLSHSACDRSPFRKTFHLDGGIDYEPLPDHRPPHQPPIVFYAGSRGPWAGVDLLLDAWNHVSHDKAQLWLCGQGKTGRLDQASAHDPRIVDYGVVPETRLRELMTQATVLVNPRPPAYAGNTLNFPSKVLDYLGTGKPVVSTWTLGLSPSYQEALVVAEPATPAVVAQCIDQVLAWSDEQRSSHRDAAAAFCRQHGNWAAVAQRFSAWLESIIEADR